MNSPDNTRIELGEYFADVVVETSQNPPKYHWIVQKRGSAEVVYWGQEDTFEKALDCAQDRLQSLVARAQSNGA